MGYEIDRTIAARRDLADIFDFLVRTHLEFGEDIGTAFLRATRCVSKIEASIDKLGDFPHQGTLRHDLGAGARIVTKNRAVLYFDVNDRAQRVTVLAVFFGGQDHDMRILSRLAPPS